MIFTQDARLTPTSNQRPRSRPQAVVSVSSPNRKILIAADLNVATTKNLEEESNYKISFLYHTQRRAENKLYHFEKI